MSKSKYTHNTVTHNKNAANELVPYILELVDAKSVLDVGCGLGTWAEVFKENGVDAIGIDYFGINTDLLLLKPDEFIPVDLEQGFNLERKFDIAICLEVAEHLSENSSDLFIQSLVNHSETIIFSAAIPNQGGDNHINEQPYDYWINKFQKHGYHFYDCFREKFWKSENIEWWYKQNMFLVSKNDLNLKTTTNPNLYIHPGLFEKKNQEINKFYKGDYSILVGLKFFLKTIINKFR